MRQVIPLEGFEPQRRGALSNDGKTDDTRSRDSELKFLPTEPGGQCKMENERSIAARVAVPPIPLISSSSWPRLRFKLGVAKKKGSGRI